MESEETRILPAWPASDAQEADTKALGDQTTEFRKSMWDSFESTEGLYFTVIEGADFGRIFLLEKIETVLGRSDDADIKVNDEKVSRHHLKVSLVESKTQENALPHAVIRDLNSTNGVFINGVRVSEQELRSGDKVKIGETILRFDAQDRLDMDYHSQLYKQAISDSLTGLANRGYFQNELSKCISRSTRYKRVFSVMLLDIDFFKKVNDAHGHEVGDTVLKTVADILMNNVRDHDVAARFGGEEFIILLAETELHGAAITAERIRVAIAGFDFTPTGCQHGLTVSIGIGEFPSTGMEAEELLQRIDTALYEAKTSGRNRVCIAKPL